ncbi:MAG: S-layer protein domain-containing protein [Methanosarcinaceae archaeon]|nr:S-layer protein domain-containing protein [Methanosarcinaceae archaeon]
MKKGGMKKDMKKDWKIIIGIIGIASLFFIIAGFLAEYSNTLLSENPRSSLAPDEDITTITCMPKEPDEPEEFDESERYSRFEQGETSRLQPEDKESLGNGKKKRVQEGEHFVLGNEEKIEFEKGYTLEAKYIDFMGEKVWVEITKDGKFLDDKIISVSDSWEIQLEEEKEESDKLLEIYVVEIIENEVTLEIS